MKTSFLFKEYIWLINKIYRSGGMTLAEINREWVKTYMSEGIEFERNTFRRHIYDIQEMFGLNIEIGKGYKYTIVNDYVLREDSVQNWLLSTLSMNNIISESMSVQERIIIESVPEVRHLEQLVEAMKENRRVVIGYLKYGSTEVTERTIEPYFIRLHKRRWYVVARQASNVNVNDNVNKAGASKDSGYRTFSFDRIVSVEITDEHFKMPKDFDPKGYFEDCFGIMRDERRPSQRIVLRAYGNERYYMEDLPVHSSQQMVNEGDGYVDYEVYMRPTSDFIGYVLSRGKWLKILQPQEVADEVRNAHLGAAEIYS